MTANAVCKIIVEGLSHSFTMSASAESLLVLRDVSFEVLEGELVCIVGPSGCGKSTLLRAIAGFLIPLAGNVKIGGKLVKAPSREKVMLFQDLYLFDWMSAAGNVEFALEARGVGKQNRKDEAIRLLDSVGLAGFERHYPQELSGGMRQRLALARSFAADPAVLLMDEPFSSLDVEARYNLEEEFLDLSHSKRLTTLLVTHDVRQAVFLADRILVMSHRPGTIKEIMCINLPMPRISSTRQSKEFHALEDALSEKIWTKG